MMPSTPMSMSLAIIAGSLTVQGITTMPSERASASIIGVRNVWLGAQILPPAA